MQAPNFWSLSAWPDLPCAYKSKTRRQAQVHVVIAMVLAFICWRPNTVAATLSAVAWAWTRLNSYSWSWEGHMLKFKDILAGLCIQIALPAVYLWTVRYRNLHASSSQEACSLQADIQGVLEAQSLLRRSDQAARVAHVAKAATFLTLMQTFTEQAPARHPVKPGHTRPGLVDQGCQADMPEGSAPGQQHAACLRKNPEPMSAGGHLPKQACQPPVQHSLDQPVAAANKAAHLQPPAGPCALLIPPPRPNRSNKAQRMTHHHSNLQAHLLASSSRSLENFSSAGVSSPQIFHPDHCKSDGSPGGIGAASVWSSQSRPCSMHSSFGHVSVLRP